MENLDRLLEQAAQALNQLYGLPAGLLVLVSCIAVGYILRLIPKFPNAAIPVVVILWAPAILPLIADTSSELPWRVWFLRNLLVGLVLGLAAWLLHNKVISKLEDKLGLFAPKQEPTPTQTDKP